ncbi:hypothetical protein ACN47E_001691 [Coniothyrium glycines]
MSRYAEVHKLANLRGAGDARPTALDIIRDENLTGKLSDKVFLITGVSAGLGIETLRALHTTGAHVYGTVRNLSKGQAVVDSILREGHPTGGKITLIELSLDDLSSVRKGAEAFLSQSNSHLNALIGNAGVMATPYGLTVDGWETQFGTNHVGHFLLFQLLKPALLVSATPSYPSRYVSVTSVGHLFSTVHFDDINYKTRAYDVWTAYGQAKTANIWLANAIERNYGAQHLHATAVHPGVITEGSGLGVHVPPEQANELFGDADTQRTVKSAAQGAAQGAATQVFAAVGEAWKHKGGKYLADCVEQRSREEIDKEEGMFFYGNSGFEPWAYDEAGEQRLWRESFGMVGLEQE